MRGSIFTLVAAGAKVVDSESLAKCKSLADENNISALVDGCAEIHIQIGDCESLDGLVILADRDKIQALLTGRAKVQPESCLDSEPLANPLVESAHKIWPKVGPFLFKIESKCDLKCNSKRFSVYIEWILDNDNQICSLKAGRLASRVSIEARDICIVADDGDCSCEKDIKLFRYACCCGKEKHNKSLIADNFDTTSVDVECSNKEAIKLFKFVFYRANLKSGSLKSSERNSNTVHVRQFIESINAYVRSRYPPFYTLQMNNVVVG